MILKNQLKITNAFVKAYTCKILTQFFLDCFPLKLTTLLQPQMIGNFTVN